ncbi:MAG: hypothetical protein O6914_01915 [Chloroflexi bacterium]|nr:hypothetical protein [Chloroflexota bacterium]
MGNDLPGVAFSAALTVGVIVLILLTSGRAGAVGLTLESISGESITQGQSRNFVLDLEIPTNELVPIQSLELDITGPTNLNVTFDPFANMLTADPHLTVALCDPVLQSGPGVGFGVLDGDTLAFGYGSDANPTPGPWDFLATQGFGQGNVTGSFVSDFRYCVTLNTGASPTMPTGSYNVQFILNTGEAVKATFSSGISGFRLHRRPRHRRLLPRLLRRRKVYSRS